MAEERVERRLAAILCADVVGYSRLMGTDEEKTFAVLQALALRCAIRSQIGVAEFVAYRDDHTGAAGAYAAASLPPDSRQQSQPSRARASENSLPQRQ